MIRCPYAEGVVPHSPGLRSYPGSMVRTVFNPEGVALHRLNPTRIAHRISGHGHLAVCGARSESRICDDAPLAVRCIVPPFGPGTDLPRMPHTRPATENREAMRPGSLPTATRLALF